jgi:hypothetical protein
MPVPASGNVCRVPHDPVATPRHDMRNSGGNLLCASWAEVRLDRLGSRHGTNLPLAVTMVFGAMPAGPETIQVALVAVRRGLTASGSVAAGHTGSLRARHAGQVCALPRVFSRKPDAGRILHGVLSTNPR